MYGLNGERKVLFGFFQMVRQTKPLLSMVTMEMNTHSNNIGKTCTASFVSAVVVDELVSFDENMLLQVKTSNY